MYNYYEGKIECAIGNREQGDMFLAGQECRDCFDLIYDNVGIRGIHLSLAIEYIPNKYYMSLALGTAKFKQLD